MLDECQRHPQLDTVELFVPRGISDFVKHSQPMLDGFVGHGSQSEFYSLRAQTGVLGG
jgi:hypothetical protein